MTDRREFEERIDRLERSMCAQKENYEEALRVQKDGYEEQKEEYEERLRLLREEHEKALLVQRDAIIESYFPGYYPLPLEHFPLEIIALIADFVHDFVDLANMALVSRRVHNGVLLSRQWIVVEEIVAATAGSVVYQSRILHNRRTCAFYACENGLLRCLRAMNLSRDEVTIDSCDIVVDGACQHGQVDVLKYLHTTYALTAQELWSSAEYYAHPARAAAPHLHVLKYLLVEMGMEVPRNTLNSAARHLETLKYLHTEIGFTAVDVEAWRVSKD